MDEAAEYHPAFSGRKSHLLGRGRAVHGAAIRLFWPTADLFPLHGHGPGHVGLVRGSDELQFLLGSAHSERILLGRWRSGGHSSEPVWKMHLLIFSNVGRLDDHPGHLLLPRAPVRCTL